MNLAVSSPSGLESVVKREIYNLIGVDAPSINGRLYFEGNIQTVAKLNLYSRTASRVYIVIGGFKAQTFDELFSGIENLDFETYVSKNGVIAVHGTTVESKLMAVSACSSIIKKAICKRLENFYKSTLLENGERYKIEYVIRHDYCTVYLDTSGEGLHKRGYRKELVGDAPLKENVAAAILTLSVWNKNKPLADLFCGSGTIPIEAGLIAKNIPSGLYRDFDFLHFKNFNTDFYKEMVENAKIQIDNNAKPIIYACDIDEKQLNIAKKHAKDAGVLDIINFEVKDMREFSSNLEYGVIVSNPPYGERLLTRQEIVKLYRDYGKVYSNLKNWSAYTLTTVSDFERLFNKKADKKRKIYNGKLECFLYQVLGAKPPKIIK